MRLIDADELFSIIEERHDLYKDCDYIGDKARRDELGALMADIVNAPTMGEWISVKDRLPDHSCTVLAYHDYGGMQVLDYSMKHKLFNCHDWNKKAELDSIKIESVTHWQPLPEPPKEESNE